MKKTVAEINEKIRSGKAVVMTAEEVARNPRSRSAKMRAAIKL